MTDNHEPWSTYWEGGALNSCITVSEEQDARVVTELWQRFADALPHSARVLDLATGNGAVPQQLLSLRRDLKITGVDSAVIRPHDHVESSHPLATVQFLANTDITQLPFDNNRFEAVTSQFGLEYSNCELSVAEAARVLVPEGELQFLVHHANSAIVRSGAGTLSEIDRLLLPGGLIDTLTAFIQGNANHTALEAAGQVYLEQPTPKSRHVSGQIFEGINRVITDREHQPDRAAALAGTMRQRLAAEQARLGQLLAAAMSEHEVTGLIDLLAAAGLETETPTALTSGDGEKLERVIIGWQIHAHKK